MHMRIYIIVYIMVLIANACGCSAQSPLLEICESLFINCQTLHASELSSRTLELLSCSHSSSPQGCPAVGKAEPSGFHQDTMVKRAFNHRLQRTIVLLALRD